MPEIWLYPNRNVYLAGIACLAGPALLSLFGLGWIIYDRDYWYGLVFGVMFLGFSYCLLGLWGAMYRPRLGYKDAHLLVFFERGEPVRVPIQIVECFFLGQGGANLPKVQGREPETLNVIVRLAEAATDWKHRDVPERWGHWCEGYITLNGAWCEPISNAQLAELNRKLIAAHRSLKSAAGATA